MCGNSLSGSSALLLCKRKQRRFYRPQCVCCLEERKSLGTKQREAAKDYEQVITAHPPIVMAAFSYTPPLSSCLRVQASEASQRTQHKQGKRAFQREMLCRQLLLVYTRPRGSTCSQARQSSLARVDPGQRSRGGVAENSRAFNRKQNV